MLNFLINPITQLLIFLYSLTGNNFGFAIILLTLIIRGVLVPITLPSLRSAKKMQDLKPHLDNLKIKHKDDKVKLQQAQLDFYKEHGINPAAGCLPQILQLVILIALYQVFIKFIESGQVDGQAVNMSFLWLNLAHADPYYVLPALAGITQLIFSLMMQSGLESHMKPAKTKTAQAKEGDKLEMAETIQQQMLFMMPIMTTVIALKFPSGLALYWVVTTLFSLVQQYIISGPGGLVKIKTKLAFLKILNPKS